jgi:cytochrome c peroxidase
MKSTVMKRFLPLAATVGLLAGVALLGRSPGAFGPVASPTRTLSDAHWLAETYRSWRGEEASGAAREMTVSLGWSKALSKVRSTATGLASVDLDRGNVTVEVSGLEISSADVWLMDNQPAPGDTVAPEGHDRYRHVGRLEAAGGAGQVRASLGADAFREFDVDLVVVTRAGERPAEGGLLFGAPTLFQRMHRREQRLAGGLSETPDRPRDFASPLAALLGAVSPAASAHSGSPLVDQGRNLFFNGTFNGNGRTCGTCHPANNNFTIDPTFISTLPSTHPLFVAERVPALAALENPLLMRQVGLVLENVDGFDRPGVMRSVPHTFGLRVSMTPAVFDASTRPPNQRTGWGGDGAPGGGTLREFAIGAVTQHFPRTLARVNGTDFRLPTDAELDAMEAFQLSLGRQADVDLSAKNFRNPVVQLGKRIFNNGGPTPDTTIGQGQCFQCHGNAGANAGTANANFNTGVENLPAQPADVFDAAHNPPDAGFGQSLSTFGGFGDGRFNTPPLVEAADTGPFFHNNAIETIEEAVNFYNSDAFNESPSGAGPPVGNIKMAATEVVAVAAFLRVLNAEENIRQSTVEASLAKGAPLADGRAHLAQSSEELVDAIEVLRCGRLHPNAVNRLVQALALEQLAIAQTSAANRDSLIVQSNQKKASARADMLL